MTITEKDKQRFFDKVDKNGPTMPHMDTPCWEWIGGISKSGYGIFWLDGKSVLAHRASWIIQKGVDIPVGTGWHGTCLLHDCDYKICVNLEHLNPGTMNDNIHDMMKKGRDRYHTNPETHLRGSDNGQSKLIESQVIEIRKLSVDHSQRQLARMFNVSRRTIVFIQQRKTWTHV